MGMDPHRMSSRLLALVMVFSTLSVFAQPLSVAQGTGWLQFGGPGRNFTVEGSDLADSWPAGGPKQVWKRDLGEGFSPIAVDGDALYTMYQRGDFEFAIALDAETGFTLWQAPYNAPITASMSRAPGPRATPLVIGNAVFTVGATGKLHRFDKETGKVEWAVDLYETFKPPLQDEYYAASPLAYRDTIIVPVGAPGASVVAFDARSGRVVWKAHDFRISYASPILIEVDGQTQAVIVMESEVIGIDPADGTLLWKHPHANRTKTNVSTPVWGPGNLLFVSSAYDSGGRMLKLTRSGPATAVEELWYSRDLRVHVANAVRVGETIYGSSGDFGPSFFSALDVRTGATRWQQRDVVKASIIHADGKFILLNEKGELLLARPGDSSLQVLASAQVLSATSWTPPSLVGTTLYLRDRHHALALSLK
jgi:outer membrane protein assembly factor BamB